MTSLTPSLLVFTLWFSCLHVAAQQTFWGTASQGGVLNQGTLYSITSAGAFTKRYDFQRNLGSGSRSDVIKATNGLYYGVARNGGLNNGGVLFSFNPATNEYKVLVNFVGQTGALSGSAPEGGVVQHSNGKLYGLCRTGGAAATNNGTLWEYDIATSTFIKRFTFTGASTGIQPVGRPVEAPNGKLYFPTFQGGASNVGSICEYNVATNTCTRFFVFNNTNGASPQRGMMLASNGLLYGTTSTGGANGVGVLYQVDPATNTVSTLVNMAVATGSGPWGELVQATDGHLYGVCSAGGTNNVGTIFRHVIGSGTITKIFDMTAATGRTPYGRLMQASNGLLYGMTYQGGTNDAGVLYSIDPVAPNTYSVVMNLADQSISLPFAGFLQDGPGNLIGIASSGTGANLPGVLFKYVLGSSQYTPLAVFQASNGASPWSAPVRASDGKFYGVTAAGGTNDGGVIYSFDPATSSYTKLVDFGLASGRYPYGKPVLVNGKLYGTCNQHPAGFPGLDGTLWVYDIGSQTFSVLLSLTSATGTRPLSGLIHDNGKLYGNTSEGGTFGYGTFFSYDLTTNTHTVLKHHRPQDGTEPYGDPFVASNGIVYGALNASGLNGFGALYQYNPGTSIYAKIHDMPGTPNGAEPAGQLGQGADGNLYGLAASQGGSTGGVIYRYIIGNPTPYSVVFSMTSAQGQGSESGLLLGTDSRLYGTNLGGGSGGGTLIAYAPSTNTFTLLRTLASADGILPYDGFSTDDIPPSSGISLNAKAVLEGPYNAGTGLMNDALRSLGTFPLTEPFTAAGFTLVGGGGETINPGVLTVSGNNAIVDWILLELRDKNNSSTVLRSKCVLLQRDGDIVDLDGTSTVSFNMSADLYFIAVRHRNHLGIMTNATVALSGSPATVDLRDAGTATFGSNARKSITGTFPTEGLWAGNVIPDNALRYSGASNDRDPILVRIGGAVPTNTVTGYWPEDVNLDGVVRYSGAANDRDIILVNIGGAVPTNTRLQQLP